MEPNNSIVFESTDSNKSQRFINNLVLIVVVIAIAIGSWSSLRKTFQMFQDNPLQASGDTMRIIVPIVLIGILCSFVFFIRKTHKKFSIDNEGINVSGKKYLWSEAKNFHMLGDSQDERTGLGGIKYTGGVDIVNPYAGLGIYVIKFRGFSQKTIRLQVAPEKVVEFENILANHNLLRESKTRMYLTGVNKWFIILFVIPFGLFALLFVYGTFK